MKKKMKFGIKNAKALLPRRNPTSNKSHGGKSLIIAGSESMFGAAVLAATSAARVGSGYVILLTDKKFNHVRSPDFITHDFSHRKISQISFDSVGFGPGLGKNRKTLSLLKELLKFKPAKVVIDADGINTLAQLKIKLPPQWILTPHEGELARLLNIKANQIKKNRLKFVKLAAKKWGCIILLKGHKTLVAQKNLVYEIQTGNESLAKAGTGDVLTGMITGFLAQGLKPLEAALLGAALHGAVSDFWIKSKNDHLSMMASDITELLPKILFRLR